MKLQRAIGRGLDGILKFESFELPDKLMLGLLEKGRPFIVFYLLKNHLSPTLQH